MTTAKQLNIPSPQIVPTKEGDNGETTVLKQKETSEFGKGLIKCEEAELHPSTTNKSVEPQTPPSTTNKSEGPQTRPSNAKKMCRVKRGDDTLAKAKKPHVCDRCGKRFINRLDLVRHYRKYTGERPFACDKCGKKFKRNENLKRHDRIHTGERPFGCPICGKSFTEKGHLRNHERTHDGDNKYRCIICGVGFAEVKNLDCHRQVHERPKSPDTIKKTDKKSLNKPNTKCVINAASKKPSGELNTECDDKEDVFKKPFCKPRSRALRRKMEVRRQLKRLRRKRLRELNEQVVKKCSNPDPDGFIASIKSKPGLWDQRSDNYRDKYQTDKLWEDVAAEHKSTVKDVRTRWKNLRDYYRKKFRTEKGAPVGEASSDSWSQYEALDFLRGQFGLRRRHVKKKREPLDDDQDELDAELSALAQEHDITILDDPVKLEHDPPR